MPSAGRKIRRFLAAAALLSLLGVLVAGAITLYWFFGPYKNFETEKFVDVERGMSSKQIATRLEREGIVRSRWAFLAVRAVNRGRGTLEAGEYRFATDETPWQVFEKIHRGDVFYEEFTVPEGSNIFDIASLLEQSGSGASPGFLNAAGDASLVADLDPLAPDLEGYLFPSTYRMTHHTTAKNLCQMMVAEFRKNWHSLNGPLAPADIHRAVTLASLVEKETGVASERPLVAAVFTNRLRNNMPLQCDPTAVYAALLENRYKGVIHKSDLASANPYNTYMHSGLPPGPITNPGKASLEAALHPAAADFLFFVARPDGSGTHNFSDTLQEHLHAVEAYRKGER